MIEERQRCIAPASRQPPGSGSDRQVLPTPLEARYDPTPMSRWLITIGLLLVLAGLAWPWLTRLGLGRLPGDIVVERDGFRFYAPITTSILASIVLSLLLWLLRR